MTQSFEFCASQAFPSLLLEVVRAEAGARPAVGTSDQPSALQFVPLRLLGERFPPDRDAEIRIIGMGESKGKMNLAIYFQKRRPV